MDRRLGIRVKLRVGGELKPRLAIEDLHVDYAGSGNPFAKGDATVTYTIHNTGNAILSAQQTVSVSGPFGWLRTDGGRVAAAAGTAARRELDGDGARARCGARPPAGRDRHPHAPAHRRRPARPPRSKPVQATAHGWAVPWTLLVLVVVLALAIVAAIVFGRRGRTRRKAREDARVREAVEQAVRAKGAQTT